MALRACIRIILFACKHYIKVYLYRLSRILVKKKENNFSKSLDAFRSFVTDVCKTPSNPPAVDIPYPNTARSSDTTSGSKKVKISGKEVMLKAISNFTKSEGDEPGTGPTLSQIFTRKKKTARKKP
jgi:hypothetical protein